MRISAIREGLNDWLPEKSRVVLCSFFDVVDWVTDGVLTFALLRAASSAANSCRDADEGFTDEFCDGGGIQFLSTLCVVAFVLGSLGMLVTLFLRRKELLLLLDHDREKRHFSVKKIRKSAVLPDANESLDLQAPENIYRRLAKLQASRAGKVASLITLVFEDVLMFVVNGLILTNVEAVSTLPVLVLATSFIASVIKVFLVLELPDVLHAIAQTKNEFEASLKQVGGTNAVRRLSVIEAEDNHRLSRHAIFSNPDENALTQHDAELLPLFERYRHLMESGEEMVQLLESKLPKNPKPIIAKLHSVRDVARECSAAVLGLQQGGASSSLEMANAAREAHAATIELAQLLIRHAEQQTDPSRWAAALTLDVVEVASSDEQEEPDAPNDADGMPEKPINNLPSQAESETQDEAEALKASLREALKEAGLKKRKKRNSSKPGAGGSLEGAPSNTKEIPLRVAARIGGILNALNGLEYGERIANAVLGRHGVNEKQQAWFIEADKMLSHFQRLQRIENEFELEITKKIRKGCTAIVLYLSSLSRATLEDVWEWDGHNGMFSEILQSYDQELRGAHINGSVFMSGGFLDS